MSPIEVSSFPKSEFNDDPHLRYRPFTNQSRSISLLSDQTNLHFGPRPDSKPADRAKLLTPGSGQPSLPLKYVSLPRNYMSFEMPRARIMPSTSTTSSRKPSRSRAPNDEPPAPSYHGYLHDEVDLLIFMEAVFTGYCPHVKRRLHNHECEQIIRSGQVWICNTEASGVQRWTDGFDWSPSRALGAFLVYRQVKKAPGQEKKLLKRKLSDMDGGKPNGNSSAADKSGPGPVVKNERGEDIRLNDYIGALLDQYDYVEDGLVKKTITLTIAGQSHHVICYYSIDDAINGRLQRPSQDPQFAGLQPRPLLMRNEKILQHLNQFAFKVPPQNNPSWFQPPQHVVYPPPPMTFSANKLTAPGPNALVDTPHAQTWVPPQSRPVGLHQAHQGYLGRASVDMSRTSSSQQYSPVINPSSAAFVSQHRNHLAMRAQTPAMPHQRHNSFIAQPRAFSVPNIQQHMHQVSQAQTYSPPATAMPTGQYYTTDSFVSPQTGMPPQFNPVSYASPPARSFPSPVHNAAVTQPTVESGAAAQVQLIEPNLDTSAYTRTHQEQPSTASSVDYSTATTPELSYSRSALDEHIDPQIRHPEPSYTHSNSNMALQPQSHLSTYSVLGGENPDQAIQSPHDSFPQSHEPASTALSQSHSSAVSYVPLNESLDNWQFPAGPFDNQQSYSYSGLYNEQPI